MYRYVPQTSRVVKVNGVIGSLLLLCNETEPVEGRHRLVTRSSTRHKHQLRFKKAPFCPLSILYSGLSTWLIHGQATNEFYRNEYASKTYCHYKVLATNEIMLIFSSKCVLWQKRCNNYCLNTLYSQIFRSTRVLCFGRYITTRTATMVCLHDCQCCFYNLVCDSYDLSFVDISQTRYRGNNES